MKNKGPISVQTKTQIEEAVGLETPFYIGLDLKPAEVTVIHSE